MVALIDELSEKFDWVLIDSPATIGTTDAARLAPCVDGTLLVVDGARGTIASVQSAARFLDDTGARLIGFFTTGRGAIPSTGFSAVPRYR